MRLKNLLIFNLIIIFSYATFAQRYDFASITLKNGNTIRGYIKIPTLTTQPKFIVYKKHLDSNAIKIPITQIKSITTKRKYRYIVAYTEIDPTNKFYENTLPTSRNKIKYIKDTILLQILLEFIDSDGTTKALLLTKYNNRNLLYILNNGQIELLKAPYFLDIDTVTHPVGYLIVGYENMSKFIDKYLKVLPIYKHQLGNYLTNCPELLKKIGALPYDEYMIYKLFKKYLECKNLTPLYTFKPSNPSIDIGIGTGIDSEQLFFSSGALAFYQFNLPFSLSISPIISLYLTYTPWSVFQDYSFTFSFDYFQLNATSEGSYKIKEPNIYKYSYLKFKLDWFRFALALEKNIKRQPTEITAYIGTSYSIPRDRNSYWFFINYIDDTSNVVSQNTVNPFDAPAGTDYLSSRLGIFIGLKAKTKLFYSTFDLEFRNSFYKIQYVKNWGISAKIGMGVRLNNLFTY